MQIQTVFNGAVATVHIEGSINSGNADAASDALAALPGDARSVLVDAAALDYLSSAGLRVLLALKKRCGQEKSFRIIHVNADVMGIFDMTGFSEIMDIEPAARKITLDGCEVIGRGACGECYRIDDETIIKLYYDDTDPSVIEHEKSIAKKAFVMGIPTAISYDIVEAEGRRGVVYEMIRSQTLCELIRADSANTDRYIAMYADVCRKIHAIHTNDPEIPSFKDANRADIAKIRDISDAERAYLTRFIDLVPDGDVCLHGDLNINNIMVQDGECCLIDMGELSRGNALFDVSRILFSMIYANPPSGSFNEFYKLPSDTVSALYEKFAERYFADNPTISEHEKAFLEPLAWFRCCTCFLKNDRWPPEKRTLAQKLLREHLIPFVDAQESKQA